MWFLSKRGIDEACFIQAQGEDPVTGAIEISGSHETFESVLTVAKNNLEAGLCKSLPTNYSSYKERFEEIKSMIDKQSIKVDACSQILLECAGVARTLDSKLGGYLTSANKLRYLSQEVTSVCHDIEVTLSPRYFTNLFDFGADSPTRIPSEDLPPGVEISYQIRGPVALLSPFPDQSCFDIGQDQCGIRITIWIKTLLSDQREEFDAWLTIFQVTKNNRISGELSRGPKLCGVPPALESLEIVFALRQTIAITIRKEVEKQLQIRSIDLRRQLSSLRELGTSFIFYDLFVQSNISIFGRATLLPRRSRQRLATLAKLPPSDPEWDIGIKIHRAIIENTIRRLVIENDTVDEHQTQATITDIVFDEFSNVINIAFVKEISAEKNFLHEDVFGIPVSVTVGVTASIEGVLNVSFIKENNHQLNVSVSTGKKAVLGRRLKPPWLRLIRGAMDFAEDIVTIAVSKSWPNFSKPLVDYPGANNIGCLVKSDQIVLLFSMAQD